MRGLKGKTAIVTGGAAGIGAAIVERFKAEGTRVVVFDLNADPSVDITDYAAVQKAVAAAGPVDILVNNAAAGVYEPVAEQSLRRRRLLFELNVHAPVDLAQAVLPGMRSRGRGWIVNISSRTSRHPVAGEPTRLGTTTTLYGASKAALERVTTGLAIEVADDGVAVNALAPVRAVRTEGADIVLAGRLDDQPDVFEPVEHMAEAALHLSTCDPACTGRIVTSGELLAELGLVEARR